MQESMHKLSRKEFSLEILDSVWTPNEERFRPLGLFFHPYSPDGAHNLRQMRFLLQKAFIFGNSRNFLVFTSRNYLLLI